MSEAGLVWVDFNDVDQDDRVITLRKFFAPGFLVAPGERFTAGDDEGNTCPATVAWVAGDGLVALSLDRPSFVPGAEATALGG